MCPIVLSNFPNWESIKCIPEFDKIKSCIEENLNNFSSAEQGTQRLIALLEKIHESYKDNNDKIERKNTTKREIILQRSENFAIVKTLSHEIHNIKTLGSGYYQSLVQHLQAIALIHSQYQFPIQNAGFQAQVPTTNAWDQPIPEVNPCQYRFAAQANSNGQMFTNSTSTFPFENQEYYYQQQNNVAAINHTLSPQSSGYGCSSSDCFNTDENSISTSSDISNLDVIDVQELLNGDATCQDMVDPMDIDEFIKEAEIQLNPIPSRRFVVNGLIEQINLFEKQEKQAELDGSEPTIDRSSLMQSICGEIQALLGILNNEFSIDEIKKEAYELIQNLVFNYNKIMIVQHPNQKGRRIIQYQQNFNVTINLPFTKDMIRSVDPVLNICLVNQDDFVPGLVGFKKPYAFEKITTGCDTDKNPDICGTDLVLTIPKNPISLEKSKSGDMKSVKEENFWMRFSVYIFLHGFDEPIELEAKSLPFKIIVAVTQRIIAFPTLIYDNACQMFDGNVDDRYKRPVPFRTITTAVRTHFPNLQNVISDRDFVEIVKIVLTAKYFLGLDDPLEKQVSVSDFFVKNKVSGLKIVGDENKISVWEWIFYLDEFIEKHLSNELIKRNLKGYLNASEANQISSCPNGTFLIRFSNSTPNAVTVEWIGADGWNCYRGSEEDLIALPLINRVIDTPQWRIHYPTMRRKEFVFSDNPDPNLGYNDEPIPLAPQARRENRNLMKYITAKLRMYLSINDGKPRQ